MTFFCWREHADFINNNGLTLHKNQGVEKVNNIKAYENYEEFESENSRNTHEQLDYLFLTTKTYDIESALHQYTKLIGSSKRLVILQNGIGNEDIIKKYCSEEKIIRIVTTNGAFLKEPGHVYHTGFGNTKIGYPFLNDSKIEASQKAIAKEDLILLKDLLSSSGIETIISEDIIKDCWEKIFVNIGINPFAALTRLRNGDLLKNKSIKRLMGEAVKEAINIAEKIGIHLLKKDFIALTYDVAEKTSENKNSMLQDILNGNPTEIDFINGRIVKYAKNLNLKVPINELLTCLVKGLENS